MKKLLIALTLCLPSLALANLWDTHKESEARYGQPTKTDGFSGLSTYLPKGKGWMIMEWFNEKGLATCVAYYQLNGNVITQKQLDVISTANRTNLADPSHWQIVSENAAGTVWAAEEERLRMELSWDGSFGGRPLDRLVLSTFEGFLGMQAALGVDEQGNTVPSERRTSNPDLPEINI